MLAEPVKAGATDTFLHYPVILVLLVYFIQLKSFPSTGCKKRQTLEIARRTSATLAVECPKGQPLNGIALKRNSP